MKSQYYTQTQAKSPLLKSGSSELPLKAPSSRQVEKLQHLTMLQRCEKYSRMHPVLYPEGVRRMIKQLRLFPSDIDPYNMKFADLVWDAVTVKGKLLAAKSSYVVVLLKELMHGRVSIDKQKRVYGVMMQLCEIQGAIPPGSLFLRNLAAELVKCVAVLSKKQTPKQLTDRNYSSSRLPLNFQCTAPTETSKSRSPKTTLTCQDNSQSTKRFVKQSRRCQEPLFQLQIKINGCINLVPVYSDDDASAITQRLKSKAKLTCLAAREISSMIQELIQEQ